MYQMIRDSVELNVPETVAYSHADIPTDYSVILSGIRHRNLSGVRWQLDESKKKKKEKKEKRCGTVGETDYE